MADFDPNALLSMPIDDAKAPTNLPVGSFLFTITERKFGQTTGEKKTNFVEFTCVPMEAAPDVDATELAAAIENKPLNEREVRHTFYLTPDALFRLKEFGRDHVGVSEEEATTTAELIEQCLGRTFLGTLGQSANKKDPSRPYVNIVSTAAPPQ